MARNLCIGIMTIWLALSAAAHAGCTPAMIADMQKRGFSPQRISQICESADSAAQPATACFTRFGACPFHGKQGERCVCFGPMGSVPGTAR